MGIIFPPSWSVCHVACINRNPHRSVFKRLGGGGWLVFTFDGGSVIWAARIWYRNTAATRIIRILPRRRQPRSPLMVCPASWWEAPIHTMCKDSFGCPEFKRPLLSTAKWFNCCRRGQPDAGIDGDEDQLICTSDLPSSDDTVS
jgi:hypothetical protein